MQYNLLLRKHEQILLITGYVHNYITLKNRTKIAHTSLKAPYFLPFTVDTFFLNCKQKKNI